MNIVIDCSVAMAFFFEDEASDYSNALMDKIPTFGKNLFVPHFFFLEVANVLTLGEKRGRCTPESSERFLQHLENIPLQKESENIPQSLFLARKYSLSVYDATYLELAIRKNAPLATLDQKLKAAAEKAGAFWVPA